MPIDAMKRQRSMLIAVVWKAMISVQIEYQSSEKVKIDLRPRLSERWLKTMVPRNSPANCAATKLAKPVMPNSALVVGVKMPLLNRPSAI